MASIGFTGGDKIERYLAEMARKLGGPTGVSVGFLEGSTYPDGTSVPLVAYTNEYGRMVRSDKGSYYQLPRPFFRNMIAAKSGAWGGQMAKVLTATGNDLDLTLRRMGELISGQLQASIVDTNSPPLAPSTVAAKGFDKPLIDTNDMRNSVEYQIGTKRYAAAQSSAASFRGKR